MAGLAGNAKFQGLDFKVAHKLCHTLGDGTEIVVVHLLVLRRLMTHQCTSGKEQVGTGSIEAFVHEEILLFPTEVGTHTDHRSVEIAAHLGGSAVDGSKGFLQRSLVVERFTGIGDEDRRNHQRVTDDEYGACGIPCRIAAGFEGGTDTAGGEARGIGLLLDKQLATELFYHSTLPVVLKECVMLFGSTLGERLEPVGDVGGPHLHGPLLHALGNLVGSLHIKRSAVAQHLAILLIGAGREILEHLRTVEDVLSVELAGALFGSGYLDRTLLESILYDIES